MMKATLKIAIPAVLLIGVILACIAFWPSDRPDISVSFLGYTNDSKGNPLATFAVTNLGANAAVQAPYNIQVRSKTGWTKLPAIRGPFIRFDAGASLTFSVSPPATRSPWRVGIYAYPGAGTAQNIEWQTVVELRRIGIRAAYRPTLSEIDSDPIESQSAAVGR